MSQGWENHEAAPLEFFHGELMDQFHAYRKKKVGEATIELPLTGTELNNLIAKAKTSTYKKYPDHIISNEAIPKDKMEE